MLTCAVVLYISIDQVIFVIYTNQYTHIDALSGAYAVAYS